MSPLGRVHPTAERAWGLSHIALVIQLETAMLVVRYVLAVLLTGWIALGLSLDHTGEGILIIAALLAHNAFAHTAFLTQRRHLFLHLANFLLYLGIISLVVSLAYPTVPACALYLIFVVGYAAYAPDFLSIFSVVLIAAGAQVAAVCVQWITWKIPPDYPPLLWHTLALVCGGWIVGQLMDYSERVRRQSREHSRDLAFSEETVRVILDTTPDPILVYDEAGTISEANEPACAFLGVPRERLKGQHFGAFLNIENLLTPPEQPPGAIQVSEAEAVVLTDRGEKKNIRMRLRSFYRANRRHHVAVLAEDIPESPPLGARGTRDEDEAARTQAEQFRQAYVETVVRRIRSPLSSVAGFVELLLEGTAGELAEPQRQALQSCRRSLQRVFALIQDPYGRIHRRGGPPGESR